MHDEDSVRPPSPLGPHDPPVFAILRGLAPERAVEVAQALAAAGIPALEITVDSPGALDVIGTLRAQLAGTSVGAGTVLEAQDVEAAARAGAQFVVSPNVDEAVITASVEAGIAALPGATTPTEALRAWRAGATLVKLFPVAAAGGPALIRAIREPLPMIPLVAVGGVDGANARAYLEAGASAVGVGSWLSAAGDAAEAGRRAAQLVRALRAPSP